jgi:formylglycine-generating enzyme required for sulfatase activity
MASARQRRLLHATWLIAGCAWGAGCGARSALDPPDKSRSGGEGQGEGSGGGGSGGNGGGGGGASTGGAGSGTGSNGSTTSNGSSTAASSVGAACGVSPGSTGPSCAGGGDGIVGCGACNETCCATLEVPPVTYYRTYTNDGSGPEGEADPATVSGLALDRYLVTVGRFRQFVSAWSSGYAPPEGSGVHTHLNGGEGLAAAGSPGTYEPGWDMNDDGYISPTDANLGQCAPASTWTPATSTNESLPINCVNWFEAYAFCIWDGGFLPSEAEWELAAAGGDQQLEYPWGSTDPGTANQYAIFGYGNATMTDCYYPSGGACAGSRSIAPVGTAALGAALYGQLDMAGDVGEWTLDWFAPYVDPCVDCAQLEFASLRSIRGGSYDSVAGETLPPFRAGRYPPGRTGDVGFRCARLP